MAHPTVESIVAGDAGAHLATCEACRKIATMLGLAVPPDAHALPGVDDSVYTDWSPLAEGRGGMGRIFRALDRRLGRFVAIKQPAPGIGDVARAGLVRRFEHEARLTARLQHPSIVGVHEAGRFSNGESFFAMPLLRGAPLSAEIDKRKTLAERLALLPHLTAVAEAVAYAHGEGIVHRDIKPANILIGTFGETVLIDWGLAKELTDHSAEPMVEKPAPNDGLTQLGVGTPQYMPPEQARGEAPEPGVDIYALGATLYHALAGEPPYGMAKGTTIRRELATSTPRSLTEIEPDVPPELADIVARAMDRDPAHRFASAQALADELRRYQTGQLLTTRRYTLGELVRHFARRHRAALRIGAIALVALIAVAVFAFVRIARERDHAELSETHAQRELRRAQGTIASQQAADPARRLDAIALGLTAIGPDLARHREPVAEGLQGLVDALSAGPPLTPLAHTGLVKGIEDSGDKLVGVDDARALVVWDARSGKQLARYPTSLASPETARVSPDHARVAVCGFENHVDVFELATGARSSLETKTNALCEFLPDGRLVIGAERVTIHDPRTLAVVDTLSLEGAATGMTVARDGLIAISGLDDTLSLWHPGTPARTAKVPASVVIQLAPDGHTLFMNGSDQHVRAVDLATLSVSTLLELKDAHLARDTLSPDGRFLAIGMFDMDGTRRSTVLDRSTTASSKELAGMTQDFFARSWVFTEHIGPLALTDVETGGTVLALDAHHDEVGITAAPPRLLTRDRVGPAFLWDLTSSFASGMLLGHTAEIVVVARRGDSLLTASHDGTIRIWRDGHDPVLSARRAELTAALWLDDSRILVGAADGAVAVIDASSGTQLAATNAGGPITSLAIDGDRIAFGALDGTLALADTSLTAITRVHSPGPVTAIALAHGVLASGHDDGSTHTWNATTGAELASVADQEPLEEADDHDGHASLAFSADGSTIYASRPSGHTLVLATKDLAQQRVLDGRLVSALDGTRVVAAAVDGTVLVHDLAANTTQKLVGHQASVLAAAFSDDRQHLATASVDGTVRIWDLATSATTLVITTPGLGPATSVAFVGDLIATGYASGALRLHPTNAATARTRACWALARFDRTRDVAPFCN